MEGQRIVIKFGSSSLTSSEGGLNKERISFFAQEITTLYERGSVPIIVTSGAVAAGFRHIGYKNRPKLLHEKQASAAVGQALLMQAYNEAFARSGIKVAQILLTRFDFSNRIRIQNALKTMQELMKQQIIPIINENDTVSLNELKFGDNDTLSALVANMVKANKLIIITDMDGLYDEDPRKNPNAKRIDQVEEISDEIWRIAGGAGSSVGTGGMRSKIEAARIAIRGGIPVFVGRAQEPRDIVHAVEGNGPGTYFLSTGDPLSMKKQWVGFHSQPKGRITIDRGAERALLHDGRSLLAAGVTRVDGDFSPGEVIEVLNIDGEVIGRGLSNYQSSQLQTVQGLSTDEVLKKVKVSRLEVIHRDEWISI